MLLVDRDGLVQVDTDEINIEKAYYDTCGFANEQDKEFTLRENGDGTFTVSKFVERLDWYIVVQSDNTGISCLFMRTLLINSALSVLAALIIFFSIGIMLRQERNMNVVVETKNSQLSSVADI